MQIEAALPYARNRVNGLVGLQIAYQIRLPEGFRNYRGAYLNSLPEHDSES